MLCRELHGHRLGFGTALRFDQDRNALWLDRDCLRTAQASRSMPTHDMLRKLLVSRVAGTSFQGLRDRMRADIALKYLRQSSLQAAQIAEILGHSEPTAFTRAFRRQHGVTPSQAQRQV